MVSMPSMHFYKWTQQLENAGHEIIWFDSNGSGITSRQLAWVTQITNWRLKWDFPGRNFVKSKFPGLYSRIQKVNENDIERAFEKLLTEIKPDLVHSFAMQASCVPVLRVMQNHPQVKWAYSSWGSDIYYSEKLGIENSQFNAVLKRINYYISDCKRDRDLVAQIAKNSIFLGVFPGNGGVPDVENGILPVAERNKIAIKAYNDGIGLGIVIVQALALLPTRILKNYKWLVYGADSEVEKFIAEKLISKGAEIEVHSKKNPLSHDELLEHMAESLVHIGCSISDGMPNAMLEAMGRGAFPIQSDPGGATSEIIKDNENGLLIKDPYSAEQIREKIEYVLENKDLLEKAQLYNVAMIGKEYSRKVLKEKIIAVYERIDKENI